MSSPGREDDHTNTVDAAAAFERGRAEDEGDDYDENSIRNKHVDEDYVASLEEEAERHCGCGDRLHCPECY